MCLFPYDTVNSSFHIALLQDTLMYFGMHTEMHQGVLPKLQYTMKI